MAVAVTGIVHGLLNHEAALKLDSLKKRFPSSICKPPTYPNHLKEGYLIA